MKRLGGVWQQLLSFENLLLAFKKARRGKSRRPSLGYRVLPDHRRLRNDNGHRFVRKMRCLATAYAQGRLMWDDINPSVQSWIGHAKQAQTFGLRKSIFSGIVFQRGRT